MRLPQSVELIEVGLRDGLQNQSVTLSTEQKLELIANLVAAGLRRLQVTSFVHPQRVPQMADAEELCERLLDSYVGNDVSFSGLALNIKGVERARAAGLRHVDMSLSASDTHSRKNAGMGLDEARGRFRDMYELARANEMSVRAGVQCAFGCVYEGAVPLSRVREICAMFESLGVDEVTLADSTGMASPASIEERLNELLPVLANTPVVLHLHDTRGLGLANVLAALQLGVTRFDTALGGLGGCPFIEGASGNIGTEDTVHMLDALGVESGVDLGRVNDASAKLEGWLGSELPSKMYRLSKLEVEPSGGGVEPTPPLRAGLGK